jgi:hypothetical protein
MPTDRVRAVWDMLVPEVREYAGRHEYDGQVQDLSPSGVSAALGRLGDGPAEPDAHDEAHLEAFEVGCRTVFGELELHRWNPLVHLANLDLACYDRGYAPEQERHAKRLEHARAWPDAVGGSLESLDRVPAPVARSLLGAIRGLGQGLDALPQEGEGPEVREAAARAHAALVERVEQAAGSGPQSAALGGQALAAFLGHPEAMAVDLGRLEELADAERDRLKAALREACDRYRPGADPARLVPELTADHPDEDGIYEAASSLVEEVTAFTLEHRLLPELGGSCLVGPAPPSRRNAMAMMSWAAPFEHEAPAWYYITPPEPSWESATREEWLSVFSATTLPAITAHEVVPGHFAHGQMLARAAGDVRRSLFSSAFVEGWAHYTEELMVEEGYRADDPRFEIGVWLEALVRVTRFAAALGVHRGTMTVADAARRFEGDALLAPAAALSEAERATYDPTYGRYTWGKLEIRALRDEAVAAWGNRYSHLRFHEALLALGSPPLGTMGDALAG